MGETVDPAKESSWLLLSYPSAPAKVGPTDWNLGGASRLVDSARLVSCLRANVGQARWPAMAVGLWSAPA
jgi:hypothetical protein